MSAERSCGPALPPIFLRGAGCPQEVHIRSSAPRLSLTEEALAATQRVSLSDLGFRIRKLVATGTMALSVIKGI